MIIVFIFGLKLGYSFAQLIKFQEIQMGNQITPQNFNQHHWELIEKNITHSLWRNRNNPHTHIEGHDRFSTDQYTYHNDKDIFQLRHQHPQLVAAIYLQEHDQHQFCSTNYKYRLFIEKIPIRLTDIEHIPYPDLIHLYHQCLHGFGIMTLKIGYFFEVEQSYIGINERGVVKVWLSKYFANSSTIGNKITQEQMVKGIIDIIDKNSDPYVQNITNIKNYLYRNSDGLTFADAKRQLQSYITTYNKGLIPTRLDCVQQAGGVYAIANRAQIYHRQQSTVCVPFHLQLAPSTSKLQPLSHLTRPQLASNTDLSQLDNTTRNIPQTRDNRPLAPAAFTPSQINTKNTETFVSPPQQRISVQTRPRINREARRTKSDFESLNFFQPLQSPQNMKYSQTIQQPIENRQLNFSSSNNNNVAINRPLQNNYQFSNPTTSQNMPTNVPNRNVNQLPYQPTNQNSQQPSLPISARPITIAGNSSSKNMSTSSILINSNQSTTPTAAYPQYQPRTIKQTPSLPKDPIIQKQTFRTFQNDISKRISPQKQRTQYTYPTTYKQPVEQKKKQADYLPYVAQQRTQLLASFNPSYTKQNWTFEPQKPIEKQYVLQKTYQSDEKFKRTSQINPDDGKSSEQFLRKLRQIKSSIGTPQYQSNKSSFATDNRTMTYNNYSFSNNSKEQTTKHNYYQIGVKTPVETVAYSEQQQFGKNAVSKIFETNEPSYRNINAFANNQPLKFQKGLSMKYSRLEADQSEPFQFRKPSAFGTKYESKIDADLLSDLNRLSR